MTIPVVWMNPERGSWSCVHLLNSLFDAYSCQHYCYSHELTQALDIDGGIIVFHGHQLQLRNCGPIFAGQMNALASQWRWAMYISVGDEGTEFPLHLLDHPNKKLWVQAPLSTTVADRYLIQGYPLHTRRADVPRDLDYFFSGQVTHARRHDCHRYLTRYWERNPNGLILSTAAFGQGLSQPDYLQFMSRARIVPCPAGVLTPDTFRVYESLECGAIPILDVRGQSDLTVGIWPMLLGADHPLPIIDDWSTLPDLIDSLLADYHHQSTTIAEWWTGWKQRWHYSLALDLMALGALSEVPA